MLLLPPCILRILWLVSNCLSSWLYLCQCFSHCVWCYNIHNIFYMLFTVLNDGYFTFFLLTLRVLNRVDATNITSKFPHWDSLCKKKRPPPPPTTTTMIQSLAKLTYLQAIGEEKKTCLCVNDR